MDHPLYAHQLEAMENARALMLDFLMTGRRVRAGVKKRFRDDDQVTPVIVTRVTNINFAAPSPLVPFARHNSSLRIPHLTLKPISKTVSPRGPNGELHPDYPDGRASVAGHYGYIGRQAAEAQRGTVARHLDYIERPEVREIDDASGEMSEVITNLPDDPEVRREFGARVWDAERTPKTHHLMAWTSDLEWWQERASEDAAPQWVKQAYRSLKKQAAQAARKAALRNKAAPNLCVKVLKVTDRHAYDRLIWCEAQPGWDPYRKQMIFKSGRGGRVQYRFVFQLPSWMTAAERVRAVRMMCDHLRAMGFMYVAAIHRPDPHNDPRNFHVHIDAYDRPCRLLEGGRWDFEVSERKRNGKKRFPERQQKIKNFAQASDGTGHLEHGKKVVQELRETFCAITNRVLEGNPSPLRYHPGPFEEAGIKLRATEKLGGEAMAAERIGIQTPVGDINAARIWQDIFDAIWRARADRTKRIRRIMEALKSRASLSATGAEKDWLFNRINTAWREANDLTERSHQLSLAEAKIMMARSRAETVVREAQKRAEASSKSKSYQKTDFTRIAAATLNDAEAHLGFIESLAPAPAAVAAEHAGIATEREEQRRRRKELAGDIASVAPAASHHDVSSVAVRQTNGALIVDLHGLPKAHRTEGKFDAVEVEGLRAWLERHHEDPSRFSFENGVATINARQAVRNRIAKHLGTANFRSLLGEYIGRAVVAECRREEAERSVRPAGKEIPSDTTLDADPPSSGTAARPGAAAAPRPLPSPAVTAAPAQADQSSVPVEGTVRTAALAQTDSTTPEQAVLVAKPLGEEGVDKVNSGANVSVAAPAAEPVAQPSVAKWGSTSHASADRSSAPSPPSDRIAPQPETLSATERATIEFEKSEMAQGRDPKSFGPSYDGFWRKVLTSHEPILLADASRSEICFDAYDDVEEMITRRVADAISNPVLARYIEFMMPYLPMKKDDEVRVMKQVPVVPARAQLIDRDDHATYLRNKVWMDGRASGRSTP